MLFIYRQLVTQQMAQKQRRAFIFLALVLSLYACGFQLRGSINLSSDMSPIYIETNSVFDLAREIKSLLASNKITVTDKAQQSKSQLILLSEAKNKRVLSVDGNGRAREYLLSYKVNFSIIMQSEKSSGESAAQADVEQVAAAQDSITVNRTWVFDPEAVLAVANEAELLYNDMRREAARLILLKLNARSQNSAAGSVAKP